MSKPRHEMKIFINYGDYLTIKSRLIHIAKVDKNALPDHTYKIRSIYFDNFNDKALMEKLHGYNIREKFRIRFYNDNHDFIKLEKKSKVNSLCFKDSLTISKDQCNNIINNNIDWLLESDKPLLHEFYHKLKSQCLRPKTIVDYTREAYIFNAGNVRVTIDSNIRSGLYSKDLFNGNLCTLPVSNTIILEVKYDNFLPEIITDLIQTNNRQRTAVSKYAACRMFE